MGEALLRSEHTGRKLKLLFAIKGMHAAQGGAERVLSSLTSYLAERGHEVLLLSFDSPGHESFYAIDSQVRQICLGIGDTLKKATFVETIRRIWAMRRVVRSERPDAVVGFMHSIYVPLSLSMLGLKVPLIASEHTVPQHYKTRRFEFLLLVATALLVERFTVVSEHVKRLYPRIVRRRAEVIPNPVAIVAEGIATQQRGNCEGVILSVGRLEADKDQRTLVEAFSRVAPKFPGWRLRIVGEGSLRGSLQQQIDELGISGHAELSGAMSDISSAFTEADIFVATSRYESFGLATAEAMAYGLPVTGFRDCVGVSELISDGDNGLLVDPSDRVSNLAGTLSRLMADPLLRSNLGRHGRSRLSGYAPARVWTMWEELLEQTGGHSRRL